MFIDLTLEVTPKLTQDAKGNESKANFGHLGTHFDVMNKEFPLSYLERNGVIFDVRGIDEIEVIDLEKIRSGDFVIFYTGFLEKAGYGTKEYFQAHPQLSNNLIEKLLDKKVSIIGIDCAGIRRGKEHTPMDQYCADHNAFVVENLDNLESLLMQNEFTINTYPMKFSEMTGLPCRVVAKVDSNASDSRFIY